MKNYIYLVQDNFSRAILSYRISRDYKAQFSFENLENVQQQYLIPAGIEFCQLITDGGPENAGPVKSLVNGTTVPIISHLLAQIDIEFSNSMIEAVNKQLKYGFLYHQYIPDHDSLVKHIEKAIHEYNNRPHHVLDGLTPMEVLNGSIYNKALAIEQVQQAKAVRIAENKRTKCCHYSF